MKAYVLSALLIAAGVPALSSSVGLTPDTVSFNPAFAPPTFTLGSNNCVDGVCTLAGTQTGVITITWSFTQPDSGMGNPSVFTYSYSDGSGAISTAGSPALLFSVSDTDGDSATGTYTLNSLSSDDGGNTVDIFGVITLDALNGGAGLALFQSQLGFPDIPPALVIPFEMVVGDCTAGGKSTVCVSNTGTQDPTATVLSLIEGAQDAAEPGTFVLLGLGLAAIARMRPRRR